MHGVPLCNESTFTIVSDRKKSDTVPSAIQNTLHNSGIYNTSAPQFSNNGIITFVAVFDAQARIAGRQNFDSRMTGWRDSYPVSYRSDVPGGNTAVLCRYCT